MGKIISYKRFINRIVFSTTLLIGSLFVVYGYFIQSSSIKQNLKHETSLLVDLIFENLYTAMQNGATKDELAQVVANIEGKMSYSSISIYKSLEDVKEDEFVKDVFVTREADFFKKGTHINFARPIIFQDKCISCHTSSKSGDIAAVIRLEFSIFDLNVSMKDILVMISILFVISILVLFTIWYKYLHKAFVRPIQNLIEQMKPISEYKDLERTIKINSNIKEVKELESVFNRQNKKLTLAYQRLEHASNIDVLTQIYNRKKFNEYIYEELELVERYNYDLSLVLIDLNKFKQINDTYGHDAGDFVLVEFTKIITKNIRTTDKFFRLGGDEFILILPHTSYEQASLVIDTLKDKLRHYELVYKDLSFEVSASFGLSSCQKDSIKLEKLLKIADERMYEEKNKER